MNEDIQKMLEAALHAPENTDIDGLARELYRTLNQYLMERATPMVDGTQIAPLDSADLLAELGNFIAFALYGMRMGTVTATGQDIPPKDRVELARLAAQVMGLSISIALQSRLPDAG